MKAVAIVRETYENGSALIEVTRKSACSGDCGTCHGCAHPEERVQAMARNAAAAAAGDRVTVESDTGAVLARASLLYILPVVLMLAGALLPSSSEGQSILYSAAGLLAADTARRVRRAELVRESVARKIIVAIPARIIVINKTCIKAAPFLFSFIYSL